MSKFLSSSGNEFQTVRACVVECPTAISAESTVRHSETVKPLQFYLTSLYAPLTAHCHYHYTSYTICAATFQFNKKKPKLKVVRTHKLYCCIASTIHNITSHNNLEKLYTRLQMQNKIICLVQLVTSVTKFSLQCFDTASYRMVFSL